MKSPVLRTEGLAFLVAIFLLALGRVPRSRRTCKKSCRKNYSPYEPARATMVAAGLGKNFFDEVKHSCAHQCEPPTAGVPEPVNDTQLAYAVKQRGRTKCQAPTHWADPGSGRSSTGSAYGSLSQGRQAQTDPVLLRTLRSQTRPVLLGNPPSTSGRDGSGP